MTRLLVIDTETGGLNPFKYPLLSVAAVIWEDGQIRDTLEVLVDEDSNAELDPDSMRVNLIDLDLVKRDGLKPSAAVVRLRNFLDQYFDAGTKVPVVGHNVGFDVAFLKRLFFLAEVDYDEVFSHRVLDTASVIGFLSLAGNLPLKGAGSAAAFQYFKIETPVGMRHTALGDAMATATLLTRLLELARANSAPKFFGALSHTK